MALVERLNTKAEQKRRLADLDRLIQENPGQLLRASELAPAQREPCRCDPLADFLPHETVHGPVLHRSLSVGIWSDASTPHERGYVYPSTCARQVNADTLRDALELFAPDTPPPTSLEDVLFFDLETTGLSGLAGIYPFLVGIGYFRSDRFHVEQFFLQDLDAEAALLAATCDRFACFHSIASYNGKSFDLPLFSARLVMNRLRAKLPGSHFDLLHPSRRLLRRRVGACRLADIESAILGVQRTHDIDGRLIPQLYFDYLGGQNSPRMLHVFDHNAQDIISLGALFVLTVNALTQDHPEFTSDAGWQAGVGEILHKHGNWSQSRGYLEKAVFLSRDANLTSRCLKKLAQAYRRLEEHDEARQTWQSIWRNGNGGHFDACIELLKFYEHRAHDYDAALALLDEADPALIKCFSNGRVAARYAGDLQRRRHRISGKQARQQQRKTVRSNKIQAEDPACESRV